jgi:hypothetical protein
MNDGLHGDDILPRIIQLHRGTVKLMKGSDARNEKPHMKDSIIKRGNSYSAAVYTGRDRDGKKKYTWVSSRSQKKVREMRDELKHQVHIGTYANPKGTVGEFVDRFLNEYAVPNLSPRTTEEYRSIFRSGIGPAMGKILLKDLKPDRIQKYYADKLATGVSTTTVTHHAMMLHRVLELAHRVYAIPKCTLWTTNKWRTFLRPRRRHPTSPSFTSPC